MSSGDSLVFDMANSPRSDAEVFVRKQWLSINDSQNTEYGGNSATLETSALSNSNRYLDYRQGYLTIPLLLTLTSDSVGTDKLAPATAATSCDYALGLKNWIGSVIHSLVVEFNGANVVQQSNLLPIFNNFKLMTTLSMSDYQMFSSIGFYPDTGTSVSFQTAASENGIGVANNENAIAFPTTTGAFNSFTTGNKGLLKRQMYFNYDIDGVTSSAANSATYGTLLSSNYANQLYKSRIFTKQNATASLKGVYQQAITGVVYLRHLADIFNNMPLLKGIFMKMTLGLSNSSVAFNVTASNTISSASVTNSLQGVQPLMISSALAGNGLRSLPADSYIASLSVGAKCLNPIQRNIQGVVTSPLAQSISLQVPSYTFQPQVELSYLSNPIKRIAYTDLYQYTIQNIAAGSAINSLVSNGISNMKKVICFMYYTAAANGGIHQLQSPFDTAGSTTAPFATLTNFNVVVSGANTYENSIKYGYSNFVENVLGTNSVNAGLTDGLSSSLINSLDWETSYGYLVTNVSRMLAVEEDVPKSLSIIGTNASAKECDIVVMVEYGTEIMVDALTGSKV